MADEREDRGFRVVDRRSSADAAGGEDPKPSAPPPHAGPAGAGTSGEPHAHGGHSAPPGFLDLLHSLQFGAMLHLGMVQGPDGKRSPVDLSAARDAIDMMGMLQEKTKGNLTAAEEAALSEGLYVLRMNYLALRDAGSKPEGGG